MPEKTKLVHILPSLDRGGAEKIVVDLITSLDLEKFSPHLILFKRGGFWEDKLRAHNIPLTILKKHGRFDLYNFWQLIKTLKKIKPTIVHTHLGGDIYGRLAAKLLKIPIIISTEHNVNYYEPLYLSYLKRWTAAWADKVVAVSQAVKDDSLKRYGLKDSQVPIIYNGLDLSEFSSSNKPLDQSLAVNSPRTIIIGTIGRLSPQKGHLSLIQAAAQAQSRNWVIKIAGEGKSRAELIKKIKKAGLENQIKLVGLVDKPAEFLNSLDIFIFPSLWEGLGIAVLEAAACGLPIISSQADGLKEIINEDNSFTFPGGDIQALAEKIDWISKNFNEAIVQQKALAAQTMVRQNFSLSKSVQAYENLYLSLLKNRLIKN